MTTHRDQAGRPVVTLFGLQLGFLLGGTVVLESIFALPGRSAEVVTVRGRVLVDRGRALATDAALALRVGKAGDALASWAAK